MANISFSLFMQRHNLIHAKHTLHIHTHNAYIFWFTMYILHRSYTSITIIYYFHTCHMYHFHGCLIPYHTHINHIICKHSHTLYGLHSSFTYSTFAHLYAHWTHIFMFIHFHAHAHLFHIYLFHMPSCTLYAYFKVIISFLYSQFIPSL